MSLNFAINYFTNFLKNNGDEDLQNKWSDSLKDFKKAFNKDLNKKTKKAGPKKNKSSYNLFCAEERLKVKDELPDLGNKDIFAELAARWKTLKEKNPKRYANYQKLADEDKERYLKEKENFVEEEGDDSEGGIKKKKSGPKKPKSSYMFFCQEERKNVVKEKPELSAKEVLVELGSRWKSLKESNPNKIKKYETMASKDKERYNNEKNSSDEEVEVKVEETVPTVEEEEVVGEEPVVVEEPKPKKGGKKKVAKK